MKKLLFLIAILSIAATCNDSKMTKKDNVANNKLAGKWTMTSYSAFIRGIPTLEAGDIVWTVDSKKSTVIVEMKDKEKTENLGLAPGSYSYEIKMDKIIIDKREYAFSIAEDGALKLDKNTDPKISRDQPVMRFKRM